MQQATTSKQDISGATAYETYILVIILKIISIVFYSIGYVVRDQFGFLGIILIVYLITVTDPHKFQ